MSIENIKIYEELIENASECAKLLTQSQIALDDGDLALSQKYFLQVKSTLSALNLDTFNEIKSLCNEEIIESDDYDISSLNLACLLDDSVKTCGVLIGMELDDEKENIKQMMLSKLIKTLNAVSELFETLFN